MGPHAVLRRLIRFERHELGPRLHLLGRRVHEWMLGAFLLVLLAVLLPTPYLARGKATVLLAVLGFYLVLKDRHDLFPSRRNRARWSWGLHRIAPPPLRPRLRGSWVPPLAAAFAGLVGFFSLESALDPDLEWRGRLLSSVLPSDMQTLSHALAVPVSAALLLAAVYLAKRRYRAYQGAVALLVLLGLLNLLKGLDWEDGFLALAAAGALAWARPAFTVAPAPGGLRSSLRLAVGVFAGVLGVATFATWWSMPATHGVRQILAETGDLLLWRPGPVTFSGYLAHFPLAIQSLSLGGLLAALWALGRPLAPPSDLPEVDARRRARELVQEHGQDTLAYFKLRSDKHYRFSSDARAFLGYRVEHGVLLVSGDPVGEPGAIRLLLEETLQFATKRGLRVAALGSSQAMLPLYRDCGLRAIYLGDEAILETAGFSLAGRPMRGVRQAVTRVERAGFRAEVLRADQLDQELLEELRQVAEHGLGGEDERGFSMAMDGLPSEHAPDGVTVLARDESGAVGGFLHYVPTFGRSAMSLALMRRLPGTPNGLTDFLIVRSVESLGAWGIGEISLNFAVLARCLRAPRHARDRLAAIVVRGAGRWFQLESLYRFNAKFRPRWEPRFLVYDSTWGLLPTALASLAAEGHLPRTPLRPVPPMSRVGNVGQAVARMSPRERA